MRRQIRLGATALVLVGLVAGCGNAKDSAPTTVPTVATVAATTAAATTAPPAVTDGSTAAATDTAATDAAVTTTLEPATTEGLRNVNQPISGVKGVSDTEIKVTSIATKTGNPLGTNIAGAYTDGIKAYFAWRNDEGGIYGRKLVLANERDDQLAKNNEEAQAMISQDDSFAAFVATLLFSGADTLDQNGIPTFGWGIHPEFGGKRNLFGHVAPTCFLCAVPNIPYIAEKLGLTKVGVLAYGVSENSKLCGDAIKSSVEKFGPAAGGSEIAFFDVGLPFGLAAGIAPQVSEMKDKGVQLVATCIDLNGMKVLGEELHKQGMDDVVMIHPNTYNADFVAANAEIFEGDIVLPSFVPFEAKVDSEIQSKFFEYTDKLGVKREELTMVGFLNANLFFTGLLGAGPQFDRAKVVDTLRSLTGYNAGGMIIPIDWNRQLNLPTPETPQDGYSQTCITGVQVKGGTFQQWTGSAGKPWECWPNPLDAYAQPTEQAFAPSA